VALSQQIPQPALYRLGITTKNKRQRRWPAASKTVWLEGLAIRGSNRAAAETIRPRAEFGIASLHRQ